MSPKVNFPVALIHFKPLRESNLLTKDKTAGSSMSFCSEIFTVIHTALHVYNICTVNLGVCRPLLFHAENGTLRMEVAGVVKVGAEDGNSTFEYAETEKLSTIWPGQ